MLCSAVSAVATTHHIVCTHWQASVSPDVVSYNLYRSTVEGGFYGLIGNTTGLHFEDDDVQQDVTYYYVATSLDADGNESLFSNEATAVVTGKTSSVQRHCHFSNLDTVETW